MLYEHKFKPFGSGSAGLGIDGLDDREVSRRFREQYQELAKKPGTAEVAEVFARLRQEITQVEGGVQRWIACLALMCTWRDDVETIEQVEEATRRVADSGLS